MSARDPRILVIVLVVWLMFSHRTLAQGEGPAVPNSSQDSAPSVSPTNVLTNPRDLLRKMNDRGLSFQGLVVYDWSKALIRDEDSEGGFGRYSLDLSMPVDGKKLFGLQGSAGMVRLKHHMHNFGEVYDGAAQLFSNIDAASRTTLYEVWFEQRLSSDKYRLKVGKIDANTEFAAVQTAGDFLNSSMGYSPTIVAFPTYPEPKLGLNAFAHSRRNYGLGFGVFQTAGRGIMSILEPSHSWNLGQSEHPGRASFGYWRLDGKLPAVGKGYASGTQGFYSVLEQSIWLQSLGQQEVRRLSGFVQAGWAEGRVSSFTHHLGGGAVLQGPFRKRSQDGIGVAATWVRFSSQPAAGFNLPGELTVETYYKVAINRHVALAPDFQFLHHPGGLLVHPDCPVITPRLVVSF